LRFNTEEHPMPDYAALAPHRPFEGRNANGRFGQGNPGGPGRPRGSGNRVGRRIREAILADFEANQEDILERVRTQDRFEYFKLIVSMLPQQVEMTTVPPEEWSEGEIEAAWREVRGVLDNETDRRLGMIALEAVLIREEAQPAGKL
jgi:hypothetical protein